MKMEGAFCCSADERLNYISIAVSVYGHGEQDVFQSHEQILVA